MSAIGRTLPVSSQTFMSTRRRLLPRDVAHCYAKVQVLSKAEHQDALAPYRLAEIDLDARVGRRHT